MNQPEPRGLITRSDIDERFTHHPPVNDEQKDTYYRVRCAVKQLAELLCSTCPVSRETSLAVTKLEEALMWANASIARHTKGDPQ